MRTSLRCSRHKDGNQYVSQLSASVGLLGEITVETRKDLSEHLNEERKCEQQPARTVSHTDRLMDERMFCSHVLAAAPAGPIVAAAAATTEEDDPAPREITCESRNVGY
eukprot:9487236-Pyramimonas_sp.AAC.2